MMIAAVGAFALMDAVMKQLVLHHGSMQVAFLRGAASLPLVLLVLAMTGRVGDLKPVRWSLHLLRGVLSVGMLGLFVYALQTLSLADAYAIYLSAPLLITALSVPLLAEHVEWRRWVAIAVGMAGVLVILRPTATSLITLGGLAAFASAVLYAANAIAIRVLTRTDTSAAMVFWTMFLIAGIAGIASIPAWTPLHASEIGWVVALGITGTAGQFFITQAFRLAPASVVAPFEYTALLWGIGLDWIFWSTLPGSRMLAGASLVVASGLYLILRERRRR